MAALAAFVVDAVLAQLAGHKLDRDCVEALAANRAEVDQIQARFREDAIG